MFIQHFMLNLRPMEFFLHKKFYYSITTLFILMFCSILRHPGGPYLCVPKLEKPDKKRYSNIPARVYGC